MPQSITIDETGLEAAHAVFVDTAGTGEDKTRAAIGAYLWTVANPQKLFGMDVGPSLEQLRKAFDDQEIS